MSSALSIKQTKLKRAEAQKIIWKLADLCDVYISTFKETTKHPNPGY